MKKQFQIIIFLLITFLTIISCSTTPDTYTIEIIDGVRYIHNTGQQWEGEPELSLEFVNKIGDLDSEDENFILYDVSDVGIDHSGNIFAFDTGNNRVQKYDPDGKYLKTIGSRGEGPGELDSPWALDIDQHGKLYIIDRGKGTMDEFDNSGEFIKSTRLEKTYNNFRLVSDNKFCSQLVNFPSLINFMAGNGRPGENLNSLGIVDLFTGEIFEFSESVSEMQITYGDQVNTAYIETDKNYNIYAAFKHQDYIDKYNSEGKQLMRITRDLGYKVDNKTADQIWYGKETSKTFTVMDLTNVSEMIGIDSKARIWVEAFEKQPVKGENLKILESGHKVIEVYSNEGILLGRLPHPDQKLIFIKMRENTALFIDEDMVSVHIYKIVEK